MVEEIIRALNSDSLEVKLAAVNDLSPIPQTKREEVFNKILETYDCEVRQVGAKQIDLCPQLYKRFFADPAPEVRIILLERAVFLRETLNSPDILAQVCALAADRITQVRVAAARVLLDVAQVTQGEEDRRREAIQKVMPTLKVLLADESADVRVVASSNLHAFTSIFGFDFLFDHLADSIKSMLVDDQWRLRACAVEILVSLGLAGDAEFVNSSLLPLLQRFLRDNCAKVRAVVASGLVALTNHLGPDWLKGTLFDIVSKLVESNNFLDRQLYLQIMCQLIPYYPAQYQSNMYQPSIKLLHDHVHNVTLMAIEVLSKHQNAIHPFRLQHEVKPMLQNLVTTSSNLTIKEMASAFLAKLQ